MLDNEMELLDLNGLGLITTPNGLAGPLSGEVPR